MPRPGTVLAILAAACLAACASPPAVPVPQGSRVLVRLDPDGPGGVELALANASHPDLAGIYSRPRDSAYLKLAPDELMGELLASLQRNGLARFGTEGAAAPAGPALVVEHDDTRTVLAEPAADDVDARRAWVRLQLTVDHYYQHVGALQYVENPEGHAVFREGGP